MTHVRHSGPRVAVLLRVLLACVLTAGVIVSGSAASAWAAGALPSPAASEADDADGDTSEVPPAQPPVSGPTAIAIPYLGTADITPAPGWTIVDCAAPVAASALVTACEPEGIVLTATTFDPELDAVVIPVGLTNGFTSMVFEYSVTLAPPEAPTVQGGAYPFPVAAGSVVMIPLSDLGIECLICAKGGASEVVAVEPAAAGVAAATGTHIIYRPAAAFSGVMSLKLRFADDFGSWSNVATLELEVYKPIGDPLMATSVYAAVKKDTQLSLELLPLVFTTQPDELSLLGCGVALHGTVVCTPDGTVSYAPVGEFVDQFSYHVALANGEQATGTVTLVPDGAELPREGLVPASAINDPKNKKGVPSKLVPLVPVENESGGVRVGVFADLIGTLDRVGAR